MDLLSIPSNTGSLKLVQWPLFLLTSKVQPDDLPGRNYLNFLKYSSLLYLLGNFIDLVGDGFGCGL